MTDVWKSPPAAGKMWINLRGPNGHHTYEEREIDIPQTKTAAAVPKLKENEVIATTFSNGNPPLVVKKHVPESEPH